MRNRDRVKSGGFRVLHSEVTEAAMPCTATARAAWERPSVVRSIPYSLRRRWERPARKEHCLESEGTIRIHKHVLGMTTLQIQSGAFLIGAEIPAAALAPFAAPTGSLDPGRAYAIAYFSAGNIRGRCHNLADRFVTEDSGKLSGNVSKVSCTSV